jgi:hypothetical protein
MPAARCHPGIGRRPSAAYRPLPTDLKFPAMPPGDDRDAAPQAVSPLAPERGPSMIDLLRLSRSRGFSPGDQVLYRQIAK